MEIARLAPRLPEPPLNDGAPEGLLAGSASRSQTPTPSPPLSKQEPRRMSQRPRSSAKPASVVPPNGNAWSSVPWACPNNVLQQQLLQPGEAADEICKR